MTEKWSHGKSDLVQVIRGFELTIFLKWGFSVAKLKVKATIFMSCRSI